MPKVRILRRNADYTNYSSYADARAAADPGDLIQIWANLDEKILLKNEVDIWIAPGVTLNRTGATVTMIDNADGYTSAVKCKIYGYGKIQNNYTTTSARYECIKTINPDTQLSVECDTIEGLGGGIVFGFIIAPSVNIENATRFHLTCNKVVNQRTCAIKIGNRPLDPQNIISDININVTTAEIESDVFASSSDEGVVIANLGTGFIKIDEIICRHSGHCFMHAGGDITANIRKLSSITNDSTYRYQTVIVNHGTTSQKLILYFDEILALQYGGGITSSAGIEVNQGTGIIIGRRIYSKDGVAIYYSNENTRGYICCNEVISEGGGSNPVNAVELDNFMNEIIFDANYVQGWKDNGVIYSNGANAIIKNAKIKNTYTGASPSSIGIFITNANGTPIITLNNLKIVVGNTNDGKTIHYSPSGSIDIKNYGLLVNKAIDESKIVLKIGTGLTPPSPDVYNYQYIVSLDLD